MGMDVYGKAPKSEAGKYFRNNCWWWRPLWNYCCDVAVDIIDGEVARGGQFNDGAGLDALRSQKLAARLTKLIRKGDVKKYEKAYAATIASVPDETCDLCGGTGKRHGSPREGTWTCNKCEGKGAVRPSETWYPFSEKNVREFAAFLRDCGGFEIY